MQYVMNAQIILMLSLKSFENEKDFWLGIQNLSLPLKNYIRLIEAKPAHF